MTIAIFTHKLSPETISHTEAILEFFESREAHILLDQSLYYHFQAQGQLLASDKISLLDNDNFNANYALSIGGDGTFLNTAALIGHKNIPILGINTGRLGFLADVSTSNLIPALEEILSGNFESEERTLLHVTASDGTVFENPFALNEISVLKQDISSMISINAHLNSEAIHTYQADGLLVSTPTGSTAYSLSVGGPIVAPQAQIFLLSPVASHSLNVRPLVIPDSWTVDLEVQTRSHCYQLAIDGRTVILNENVKLRITKAPFNIQVIKVLNQTFFTVLRNKLMWGVDKRN